LNEERRASDLQILHTRTSRPMKLPAGKCAEIVPKIVEFANSRVASLTRMGYIGTTI